MCCEERIDLAALRECLYEDPPGDNFWQAVALLRSCPGLRATMQQYQASAPPLACVSPPSLAVTGLGQGLIAGKAPAPKEVGEQ